MKRDKPSPYIVKAALFVTGMSEGIVQVIVLREILAGFSGTELLTGIILSGWMVLNSMGCLLSSQVLKNVSLKSLLKMQTIVGAAAFFTSAGMLAGCSYLASNSHSQINWLSNAALSLLVLLPFCVLSGILYAVSVRVLAHLPGCGELKSASEGYIYDSAGMLTGFLFATFFLITRFNTAESALLVLGINLLVVSLSSLLYYGFRRTTVFIIMSGILVCFGVFAWGMPEKLYNWAAALRVPHERLEETKDTRYSRLLVTSIEGQYNFYSNGYLEGAFPDFDPAMEKRVHFALLVHKNPRKVFIMGGFTSGVLDEVLKHKPVEIVYGDTDPEYISMARKYIKKSTGRLYDGVKFITSDVRSHLQQAQDIYDVVILIPPPPATLSANRYYTEEFFRTAGNALKEGGLFCTCLYSSEVYAGGTLKRLNHSILKPP